MAGSWIAPFFNNFPKTIYFCTDQYYGTVSTAQKFPEEITALQAFEFYPASTTMHYNYDRINLVELIAAIGGLMYTLRTISNNWVFKLQDYSLDADMM